MIYLLYDAEWDNWKQISFEEFERHFKSDRRVMAVVVYAQNKI